MTFRLEPCHAAVLVNGNGTSLAVRSEVGIDDDTKFKDDKYNMRANSSHSTDRMNYRARANATRNIGWRENTRNLKSAWNASSIMPALSGNRTQIAQMAQHQRQRRRPHNQIEWVSKRLTQIHRCHVVLFHFGTQTQDVCRCGLDGIASTESNLSVTVEHTELVRVTNRIWTQYTRSSLLLCAPPSE